MTTQTITKQFATLELSFSYENDVTQKELNNIQKKVTTFINNAEYNSTVSVFVNRNEIRAIVTFDITDGGRKIYDELRSSIGRLIDSHKQPATAEWAMTTFGGN